MNDLIIMERQNIVDIADAIRNKTGVNEQMTLVDMVTSINEIETGGEELPSAEEAAFGNDNADIETGIVTLGTFSYPNSTTKLQPFNKYTANETISIVGLRVYPRSSASNHELYLYNENGELVRKITGVAHVAKTWTNAFFDEPVNIAKGESFLVSGSKIQYTPNATTSDTIFNGKVTFVGATTTSGNFPSTVYSGKIHGVVDIIIGTVDHELPESYEIARTTLDDIANEIKRIADRTGKITTAQIQSGLESVVLQEKSVTPTAETQTIAPDNNYYGLSKVTVNPALLQEKTVTPTTEQQEIVPDSGYYGLSKVTVEAAAASEELPSAEKGAF